VFKGCPCPIGQARSSAADPNAELDADIVDIASSVGSIVVMGLISGLIRYLYKRYCKNSLSTSSVSSPSTSSGSTRGVGLLSIRDPVSLSYPLALDPIQLSPEPIGMSSPLFLEPNNLTYPQSPMPLMLSSPISQFSPVTPTGTNPFRDI